MKPLLKSAFRIICAILLVFSTMAPSLVSANSDSSLEKTIFIDPGSDEREISWSQMFVSSDLKDNNYYSLNLNYNDETQSFTTSNNIEPNRKYRLGTFVSYVENDISYTYIDEKILTGVELLGLTSIKIPAEEELTKKTFLYDAVTENGNSEVIVALKKKEGFPANGADAYVSNTVVTKKNTDLEAYALVDTRVSGEALYMAGTDLVFDDKDVSIAALNAQTVEVSYEGDLEVDLFNVNGNYGRSFNQTIKTYVTPGNYRLTYNVNDLYWEGKQTITEATTLTVPTEVTGATIEVYSAYTDSNNVNQFNVNYNLKLKAGNFTAQPFSNFSLTARLLDGEKVLAETDATSYYANFDLEKVKSGKYTFQLLKENEAGELIPLVSEEVDYKSAWNELEGTVFTAENAEGEPLKDATITIYEYNATNSAYNHVFNGNVNTEYNEMFVPNTYIHKDFNYLAVIQDFKEKVLYVKQFVGQSSYNFKFIKDDLKPITIHTGDLQTDSTYFQVVTKDKVVNDKGDSYYESLPVYFEKDWSIATDFDVTIDWRGYNADKSIGYQYRDLLTDSLTLDLTAVEWKTAKPHQYAGASSVFELTKPYEQFNYAGDVIPVVQLVVKKDDIRYSSHLLATEETVKFNKSVGFVNYASSTSLSIYYSNNISVEGASFVYEITGEEGFEPIRVKTSSLSYITYDKLPVGNYTIRLVESTVDSLIVDISLEDTFTIADTTKQPEVEKPEQGLQYPATVSFEQTTPYGELGNMHNLNVSIQKQFSAENDWRNIASYYYNGQALRLDYYGYNIEEDTTYQLNYSAQLANGNGVMNVVELTGKELVAALAKPLQFPEQLFKQSFDFSGFNLQGTSVEIQAGGQYAGRSYFYLNKDNVVYMPKTTAKLSMNTFEKDYLADLELYNGAINSDNVFVLGDDSAQVQIVKNETPLALFGMGTNGEFSYTSSFEQSANKALITKGTYSSLTLGVIVPTKNNTPWGYEVRTNEVMLTDHKTFNFDGKIEGVLNDIRMFGDGFGIARVSLKAGDLEVGQIYNASEYGRWSMLGDEPIVRTYIGLFDTVNRIYAQYEVLNEEGEVVASNSSQFNPDNFELYFNKPLEDGNYTLKVKVPVGPSQTLKLEKAFTVDEDYSEPTEPEQPQPTVKITSKNNGITNEKDVTVSGTATEVDTLTAKLMQGETVIETKNIIVEDNAFEVTFAPEKDGEYAIEVGTEDGGYTSTITFTIDRTAPEKATNIKVEESASGLQVKWDAEADAVTYKVEVAKNDGKFVASDVLTNNAYVMPTVEAGATYKVRVVAIDKAGNESTSDAVTKEIAAFATTSTKLEDKRNKDGLLVIGQELAVTLTGSYKEGYKALATVVVDGTTKDVALNYNEETEQYKGTFVVEAGMKMIESISGVIIDGDNKTDEFADDMNWSVGVTVTGFVTDGTPVENAKVRLDSTTTTYTATTDAEGKFTIEGMQAGEYATKVTVDGRTTVAPGTVKAAAGELVKVQAIQVQATTTPTITFVDSIKKEAVTETFYVKVTDGKKFTAYGEIAKGKFAPYTANQMKNISTGTYTVTVYGTGLFEETTANVTFKKDVTNYTVEVSKVDANIQDITFTLPEGVETVQSVSLYSYDVVKQFNYNGLGSHYAYDVKVKDGKVVVENVAAGKNYELYVSVAGYMPYAAKIDLTTTTEVAIELEKGRVISGKVTDNNGMPLPFQYIYAYGNNSYTSATTDAEGNYELIGLDKTSTIQIYTSSDIYLDAEQTVKAGTEDTTVDFKLAKAGSITGKVTDKVGKVLTGVSISAQSEGENTYYYGWGQTATDGSFAVNGLNDSTTYTLQISRYGYPTVTVEGVKVGDNIEQMLQKAGKGNFDGEGNFLSAAKSTVVEGDRVQFTLSYANNGTAESTNVPVTLSLPKGLTLINESVQLNGKAVDVKDNKVIIPVVEQDASGKITFDVTVGATDVPTLTVTAKVEGADNVLSAAVAPVFVTLQAPAQASEKEVKVYGTAKHGSTVEVYAGDVLVGQTTVDSKWWYVNAQLPVAKSDANEMFTLTAKVKDGDKVIASKPVKVEYAPNVPSMTDVTVYAGWNGDVKLNPNTGVATFAITEHTAMDTTIVFDKEVDTATLNFLGEQYKMTKGKDNTFTFDGNKLGRWTSYGEQLLTVTYKKGDVEVTVPLMNIIVLIDPSGFVFEDSMSNKLEGVKAVVEVKQGDNWVMWDAEKFGQINPQTTDAEGKYGWDVIAGEWRVIFTKEGYEPYISRVMSVPPAETELNIPMVKIAAPIVKEFSEKELQVEFDRYMTIGNDVVTLVEVTEEGEVAVAGTVETAAVNGYKAIAVPADKQVGFVQGDSNEETGFFAEDTAKQLSKTFTFKPSTALKAETTYKFVVSAKATDANGKELGNDVTYEFTTAKAPITEGGTTPPATGDGTPTPSVTGGVTPPAVGSVVTPPATENVVTEQDIEAQLKKGAVEVKASAATTNAPSTVTVSAAALAKVADAKQTVTMKAGDAKFTLSVATLKQLAKDAKDVQFSVAVVKVDNGLTPAYNFTATVDGKAVASFKEAVEIALRVDATKVKSADKVAVYTLDAATNTYKFVLSKYENGTVTFKTNKVAPYVVFENNKTFKDVDKSWARAYIDSLASKGIIQGKTADEFAPEAQITRTQFAVLLTRMLNLPTDSYKGTFSDVSANNWAAAEIEAAAKAGIITGSNGKFMPNDNITRQQMVAMIVRAMKTVDAAAVEGAKATLTFADAASIQAYAKENVEIAVALGIISGKQVKGQTVFAPADFATRAQASKMLYTMLEQF